jgi:hypothetical protein
MTMSLSLARPILMAPGVSAVGDRPGRRIFIIDVARFAWSPPGRPLTGAGGAAVDDGGR